MTQRQKRSLGVAALLLAPLALIGATVLAVQLGSESEAAPRAREIVLEARELAFSGDNPTLTFKQGERVRLIVRNSDPGVLHSITLPGIEDGILHVAYGDEKVIEFTARRPGTYEYVCPQHLPLMQGKIVVTE